MKAILLEHISALTHMEEVGQQSDSVSDRSCQHAALTGCTLHFGNSKYNISIQAAENLRLYVVVKTIKDKLVLPEKCRNIYI